MKLVSIKLSLSLRPNIQTLTLTRASSQTCLSTSGGGGGGGGDSYHSPASHLLEM
jgi:hypothetical protein